MSANQMQIDRPETNTRIRLTIVPTFPTSDPRSKVPGTPEGSSGIYRVTFVLSVPGRDVFRDHLEFEAIMQSGDSLLQTGVGTYLKVALSAGDGSAEILLSSNSKGVIASAQMRVDATSFYEAERTAYDLIAPQLSYWSFLHDVALDVAGYEVLEEKSESRKYFFGMVGQIKPFNHAEVFVSTPEHRRLLAAYREAMNSTNVFYQALSFYKVAEGVTALRTRTSRRNRTAPPTYSNECLPNNISDLRIGKASIDELTEGAFGPYLGKDFDTMLTHFKELIRNAVAHLAQLDDVLDADKFEDVWVCMKAIPVLRYIAHQLLQNDLGAKPNVVAN